MKTEFLIAYQTIVRKEFVRFARIWVQTILPSVITIFLYITIFGNFIGDRIGSIDDNLINTYINYISENQRLYRYIVENSDNNERFLTSLLNDRLRTWSRVRPRPQNTSYYPNRNIPRNFNPRHNIYNDKINSLIKIEICCIFSLLVCFTAEMFFDFIFKNKNAEKVTVWKINDRPHIEQKIFDEYKLIENYFN